MKWPERVVILGGAHGSLALARSLGQAGVPVYYVTNDSPLAGWSRHVAGVIRWPGPDDPEAVERLLDIASRNDLSGALLVAASDPDVKLVSQRAHELSATFKIMLPEWVRLQWLCDKPYLYRLAAELGLAHPKTYDVATIDEALQLVPDFPVVLKPNMGGGRSALAKAKVMRIDNRASFIDTFDEAAKELGAKNIVVQQLIPGGGECQFSYAALWADGEPVAEFTARRSRQYPVDFGFTSTFVETVDMPEVTTAARTILTSVSYSGLVEIEFKRDPRTGVLNILDVNPRPWSWFGLSAAAGVDLGKIMWDVVNGRAPERQDGARPSTAWMYLARDVVSSAILMTRGKLQLESYLTSFRNVRAWAAFSWDDLKPGMFDLPLTLFRVVTRRILHLSQ